MAKLIDADEIMKALSIFNDIENGNSHFLNGIKTAKELIEDAPTITTFHVIDNKTGKEADLWEIALKEDWAKSLCYCDMEGFAIEEDGTLLLLDECGRHEYCDPDRFEVVWDDERTPTE